ncbi:uncharacterized protein BT62DRAFT_236872 [Guyanagaster necrorhizus]|uniref:RRM domain-containing protein n=1 Tax=Guyanagaster necrorhizus TaxID=856835 RepID=A0A9P7VPD2_9AGAR|nr:uncharacterized protein BT62DRAFT_236872 [Guyanagaster necrorhizus MCA 3950]KAG7444332.1 hypothetical protein BT62DRAFT_236872 [Guyanagaster necrorhizus MCA 3950]
MAHSATFLVTFLATGISPAWIGILRGTLGAMEVFVRNVSFSISEENLRVHLARKIHILPIQNPHSPLLNFELELFHKAGSAAYRGMGLVTFPDTSSANTFLQLYSVMAIGERSTQFQRSRQPTNQEKERRQGIAQPSP